MEKSLAHWRAEHPLLFVSMAICIGLLLQYYAANQGFIVTPLKSCGIMVFSLIAYYTNEKYNPHFQWQGIFIIVIMIVWGFCMGSTLPSSIPQFKLHNTTSSYWIASELPFIKNLREAMIQKMNLYIITKEESGFAQALLLGVKSSLDKNILKAYLQLGIIHIIAISGMHIDLIFKSVLKLTQWKPQHSIFKWLELILLLGGVWTYTLIAFASASIVRASIFFSIYLIGRFFNQPRYTLNCIAGGLLMMLLWDSKSGSQIGLQLSYAAVVGIYLFHPLLQKLVPMDNVLLTMIWSSFSISFAAQLTTLPLLLYHFHQISPIILVSNFIIVPLSNLLLYALLIFIISPSIWNIAPILGNGIQYYIHGLNRGIMFFYEKGMGNTLYSKWDSPQVCLYYLCLFWGYLWWHQAKARYLLYILGIVVVFQFIKLFSS